MSDLIKAPQIKVELLESMGNDRSICESAWTSSMDQTKKSGKTEEDVKRVINLLADEKHSTPFESVIFKFWMKVPIQTDRQIMTHRLQSASGMSARYRTMPDEFLVMSQDIKDILLKVDPRAVLYIQNVYHDICAEANQWYREQLKLFRGAENQSRITNDEYKRLREFFRGVLPQNNMTERVSIFNLRSFANFYKLRSHKHAQPEIQVVANLMLEAVKQQNICPIALEALERNEWKI